ncbi:uncharacterized protein LOC126835236 [Adelges cooleyi]|uniref:uncharacterized protein LOC126835236 n=1 Tax=Adelges cooleyi TaxID=133065 RepID=UPI0021807842|nr:uncharacterized protein LOC126835236 [Adelges cooleyi]
MKLFWFLVSCVIVIVSTDERTDYKRSVSITNNHLYRANGMTIANTQTGLMENALEHVIEQIVDNDHYSLEFMNNMFAVPDFFYSRSFPVCEGIQTMLRREIHHHLGVIFPNDPDPNFESYTLIVLAAQRRTVTLEALKRMWNRSIVRNYIYSVHVGCRFIAVFISTKYPTHLSKNVEDVGDQCTISHVVPNSWQITKTFRKFKWTGWKEVIGDDMDDFRPLQPEPVVTHLQ